MASDPERPIEQRLRACAKLRREQAGAPFELHPATRRLLQGEVARQFKQSVTKGKAPLARWLGSLPRLAWAGSVAAILVLLGVLFLPSRHSQEQQFARTHSEFAGGRGLDKASAPSSAPAAAPAVVPEQSASLPGLAESVTKRTEPRPSSAIAPSREAPAREGFDSRFTQVNTSAAEVVAKNLPLTWSPPSATLAGATAKGELAKDGGIGGANLSNETEQASRVLQFVQTAPLATTGATYSGKASESIAVLNSFQVEQTGLALQIIDNDGSIYSGQLETASAAVLTDSLKTGSALAVRRSRSADALDFKAAAPPPQTQTWSNFFFRVSGTNRTLNQQVVFTGNVLCPPATQPVALQKEKFQAYQLQNGLAPAEVNVLLQNSRISGKAVIDGKKELEINAQNTSH